MQCLDAALCSITIGQAVLLSNKRMGHDTEVTNMDDSQLSITSGSLRM
jgi:hypothetical protein